jgi:hypothetical protein
MAKIGKFGIIDVLIFIHLILSFLRDVVSGRRKRDELYYHKSPFTYHLSLSLSLSFSHTLSLSLDLPLSLSLTLFPSIRLRCCCPHYMVVAKEHNISSGLVHSSMLQLTDERKKKNAGRAIFRQENQ